VALSSGDHVAVGGAMVSEGEGEEVTVDTSSVAGTVAVAVGDGVGGDVAVEGRGVAVGQAIVGNT
jgi:hypothetical protein